MYACVCKKLCIIVIAINVIIIIVVVISNYKSTTSRFCSCSFDFLVFEVDEYSRRCHIIYDRNHLLLVCVAKGCCNLPKSQAKTLCKISTTCILLCAKGFRFYSYIFI